MFFREQGRRPKRAEGVAGVHEGIPSQSRIPPSRRLRTILNRTILEIAEAIPRIFLNPIDRIRRKSGRELREGIPPSTHSTLRAFWVENAAHEKTGHPQ